jgi:hypothetical protein
MGDRERDAGRCAVVGGNEGMVLTKRFFREARFAGRRRYDQNLDVLEG